MLKSKEEFTELSTSKMFIISFVHLIIAVGIVSLSTYIPAELRFLGWQEFIIAYILGITTIFELIRLIAGYLGDKFSLFGSYRKNYVLAGFLISSFGYVIIVIFINSLVVILGMIFLTAGTAIMSTMIDAYLIDEAVNQNKNRIAAMTQFFRLSGFALGGILGLAFYGRFTFEIFFLLLFFIHISGSLLGIFFITENNYSENRFNSKKGRQHSLKSLFRSNLVLGMSLFLVLYPIGLFAQDAVLEPFAIDYLRFEREGIGRMASIWGITTLIFILLALLIEKKTGRMPLIILGLTLASISLIVIASLGLTRPETLSTGAIIHSQSIFYLSLATFGIGLGLMTTPATAIMFDICSHYNGSTAFLIAIFGVIVTISRSFASFLAGFILQFTSDYVVLFSLEAIILFSSLIPLIYVYQKFKNQPIEKTSPDLANLDF